MGSNALNIAQAVEQRANSLVWQIYYAFGYPQGSTNATVNAAPWRPPEWASKSEPLFAVLPVYPNFVGPIRAFVFDGPMEITHERQSVVTMNPIQTGAPISDHAYVLPARLTVRLLMSDSMQSYAVGQFSDGASRSVSAWQQLKTWQEQKTFLSVATRLNQYENMLVTGVGAVEEPATRFAGKFTVTFTQVLTASLASALSGIQVNPDDTSDPQTLVETPVGQLNLYPVPEVVLDQNGVPELSQVPAAGNFSSSPFSKAPGEAIKSNPFSLPKK